MTKKQLQKLKDHALLTLNEQVMERSKIVEQITSLQEALKVRDEYIKRLDIKAQLIQELIETL